MKRKVDASKENKCSKRAALDIMQQVVNKLKSNKTNQLFIAVLEKMMRYESSTTDIDVLRMDVTIMFLKYLRKIDVEDYSVIFHDLQKLFLPRELKKIIVKDACLRVIKKLGEGDFGMVCLAKPVKPGSSNPLVAVKVAKEKDSTQELLLEAIIMSELDHPNVVKLLAVQLNPMNVIMEYIQGGHLEYAAKNGMAPKDILRALYDVAAGMEYISGKKIVHRDLDTTNIFVDANKSCKIGDFGLARYVGHNPKGEYKDKGPLVVIYLLSPETVDSDIYTTKSDVWGFAILAIQLYEISNNVSQSQTMKKLLNLVTYFHNFQGTCSLLPKKHFKDYLCPKSCPKQVFQYICKNLLNIDPNKRPNFTTIKKDFKELLNANYI